MSKFLEWRDDWALGIDTLDEDHRRLVDHLNRVADLCGKKIDPPQSLDKPGRCDEHPESTRIMQCLESLSEEVKFHFEREEAFMKSIGYPDLADHKFEHISLLAELREMMRELCHHGVDHLEPNTLKALKHWIIGHVVSSDREIARYYYRLAGAKKLDWRRHSDPLVS